MNKPVRPLVGDFKSFKMFLDAWLVWVDEVVAWSSRPRVLHLVPEPKYQPMRGDSPGRSLTGIKPRGLPKLRLVSKGE